MTASDLSHGWWNSGNPVGDFFDAAAGRAGKPACAAVGLIFFKCMKLKE